MKLTKRFISLILVFVMTICMSVTAFASGTEDGDTPMHSVTIYFQRVVRDSAGAISRRDVMNEGRAVVVEVSEGQTLKNAIIKACNENPAVVSSALWDESYPVYLTSLNVGSNTYCNIDEYYEDQPEEGWTTYEGSSWMFFYGEPSNTPISTYDYPWDTLGEKTVITNITFTLSYEDITMSWQ